MRKRFSAAMALALSCAMVLTACSGGSKPAETTAAAADTTAAAAETTAAAAAPSGDAQKLTMVLAEPPYILRIRWRNRECIKQQRPRSEH